MQTTILLNPSVLLSFLRELIAQLKKYERLKERFGKGKENERLIIRGLEIEKDARRVFVNGIETILTNKELELLMFLAENGNRVFGKEELFEKIWGLMR